MNKKTITKKMVQYEKKKVVNDILIMFPSLKRHKYSIYKEILGITDFTIDDNNDNSKGIILEQFIYNDKKYYKNNQNGILNNEAELIGIITGKTNFGEYKCHFFDASTTSQALTDLAIDKIITIHVDSMDLGLNDTKSRSVTAVSEASTVQQLSNLKKLDSTAPFHL